jgi:ribosomal protein S18 acetylase RimI-like enzyme
VDCSIRRALASDAEALARLATRTFYDTFARDNRPGDMAAYLAASHSPALQLAEITSPHFTTLLACIDEPIAFAQLKHGPAPVCIPASPSVELYRFYVEHAWHGRGVAAQLMHAVLAEAEAAGTATVWLGVWERNPRAIAFYRKWSFVDVGTQTFHLGSDVQTDRLMVRAQLNATTLPA